MSLSLPFMEYRCPVPRYNKACQLILSCASSGQFTALHYISVLHFIYLTFTCELCLMWLVLLRGIHQSLNWSTRSLHSRVHILISL